MGSTPSVAQPAPTASAAQMPEPAPTAPAAQISKPSVEPADAKSPADAKPAEIVTGDLEWPSSNTLRSRYEARDNRPISITGLDPDTEK